MVGSMRPSQRDPDDGRIPPWLIVVTVLSLLAIVCVIYIIRNIEFL